MSWSDHKDDKSRFDGWREFLNEGKEQQPEQVIKEEAQTISEEGDRPPRPSVYQRLVNNLLKAHPRGGADSYLGAVEGAEKWSPADLAAVGKAWELIDRLSNDISSAATVDDAWSAHRGAGVAQKEGAHTWDTAKKIAARLAAGTIALPENPAPAALSAVNESQLQQIIREELDSVTEAWKPGYDYDEYDDWPSPGNPAATRRDAARALDRKLARDIDRLGVPEGAFPPGFGELELDIRRAIINSEVSTFVPDDMTEEDKEWVEGVLHRAQALISDHPDREDMEQALKNMITSELGNYWSNQI